MFVVPSPAPDGPLAAREAEIGQLTHSVAALAQGHGAVVEIAGEPGTGKTRLLSALAQLAVHRGIPVTRTYSLQTPHTPFQLFHDALGAARPPDQEAYRDGLRERLAPTLLVLDDLHGCDRPSLDLVLRLLRSPLRRFLLVVAHRPRQSPPALLAALDHGVRTGTVARLEPGPLDVRAVAALLRAWRTQGSAPERPADGELDSLAARLTLASEGNPCYLRLLVAARWDPETWPERAGADSQGLLREAVSVVAELDALTPEAATAARASAVLGGAFRLEDVDRISGLGPQRTLEAFAELTRADLMRPAGPGGRLSFRHPVIGHVAHDSADLSSQLRAHRQALRMVEGRGGRACEQARHAEYLAGTDGAAASGILTRGAAELATRAPATAARWLRLALDSLPDRDRTPERRMDLEIAHCRALIAAGRLGVARDLAHELLADHRPHLTPAQLLKAHAVCADAERLLCRYEEAEAIAHSGIGLLPQPLPTALSAEAAELVFQYGLVHVLRGTHDQARPLLRAAARARVEAGPTARVALRVLNAFCDVFSGNVTEGLPEVVSCARLLDALPDGVAGHTPDVLTLLGCAELYLERFTDARRHLSRGLHGATGGAQKHIRAHQLLGLTMIDQWGGRLDDAVRRAQEAEELARAVGAPDVVNLATAMRAMTLVWARGRRHADEAVALAVRAVDTASLGRGWWATSAISLLAHAQLLGGDPAGCLQTLRQGGGGDALPEVQPTFRPSLLALMATATLAQGDTKAAHRLLDRADADAARLDLPLQWACVRRARAQLRAAHGEHEHAVELFEAAAEGFRVAGLPLQQAWTLVAAARSTRAVRNETAAVRQLEAAEALVRPYGATLVQEEVERVSRQMSAGPETADSRCLLSEREREIAELAAAGLRSRQIAERLFLSPRTVDSHLARVYRKLGVSSRLALAHTLAPGT
ncbi:LuxR C-terminal-related transcriptional regulator [Streptomyces sp. NPDC059828]|uniref:helix-turn-helix transcriptional regulator n=1 Tax=Streptomyces sp. NPDC059828 TaxID=3346965 RepID=UPI003649F36C